jgi:predicted GIY-YIG superfamily endonuclease
MLHKISLVSANQSKKLIRSSRRFVLLFLREYQSSDESVKLKASLKGCTKEQKHRLEELLQAESVLFRETRGLLPKREVERDTIVS